MGKRLILTALIALILLTGGQEFIMTNRIQFIVPEATTNLVANPSLEVDASGFTAVGGSVARSTAQSIFGSASLAITPTAGVNDGAYRVTDANLTNGLPYTFSIYVLGVLAIPYRLQFRDNTGVALGTPTDFTGTGDWQRVTVTYTPVATALHRLYLTKNNHASVGVFYADGWQLEQKSYSTTYVDGETGGGEWTGQPHSSTSIRDASSREGGRVIDLESMDMVVEEFRGLGTPPIRHNTQDLAVLPGAAYQSRKIMPRTVDLKIRTDPVNTEAELYAAKNQLINALWGNLLNEDDPVIMRYTGNAKDVDFYCHYDSGLDWPTHPKKLRYDRFNLRMMCYDPFAYADGNHATPLDVLDSVAFEYIAARIDGVWSNLGPPAVGAGAGVRVRAIVFGPDGSMYVGGKFTDWNGILNADNIVKYKDGVWSALGTGTDGEINAMAVAPDGTLYIAGQFQNAGGVLVRQVAKWDGSVWSAMGPPSSIGGLATVYAINVGADGTVYVGGAFLDFDGIANADGIVKWNGSAWSALTTGTTSEVRVIKTGPDGNIYVGGNITSVGGVVIWDRLAIWNPTTSTWSALTTSGSASGSIFAIAFGPDNSLYVAGSFTSLAGFSVNRVARWSGAAWESLGSGVGTSGNEVYAIAIDDDGTLHAGGIFTTAGGLTIAGGLARWNGFAWTLPDITFASPSTTTVYALVRRGDDLYMGFDQEGTFSVSGVTNITYNGKGTSYPTIKIKRSGGTSVRLRSIINLTTGHELFFNLLIQDGETINIDLSLFEKLFTSDYRGETVISGLLRGSELASFALINGVNKIAALITQAGSPTMTATIEWHDVYNSVDEAL